MELLFGVNASLWARLCPAVVSLPSDYRFRIERGRGREFLSWEEESGGLATKRKGR